MIKPMIFLAKVEGLLHILLWKNKRSCQILKSELVKPVKQVLKFGLSPYVRLVLIHMIGMVNEKFELKKT